MDKYFIGLSPDRKLSDLIDERKNDIRKNIGEQQYLSHSPHLTLVVFTTEQLKEVEQSLETLCKDFENIAVNLSKDSLKIFYDDCLTGNHTITYSLASPINRLVEVQKRVLEIINPYNTKKAFEPDARKFNSDERKNIQVYGFPFVGSNWIPHITLASVEKSKFDEIFRLVQSKPLEGCFSLNSLGFYKVCEPPSQIKHWKLK